MFEAQRNTHPHRSASILQPDECKLMAYLRWGTKRKRKKAQQVDRVSSQNVRSTADYVFNHQHFMEESFHPRRRRTLKWRRFQGRQKNPSAAPESCLCVRNMHISQTSMNEVTVQ